MTWNIYTAQLDAKNKAPIEYAETAAISAPTQSIVAGTKYVVSTTFTQVGATASGTLAAGQVYQITTIGTTDFTQYGASSNTVGLTFTATATGAVTGTGTASAQYGAGGSTVGTLFTATYTGTMGGSGFVVPLQASGMTRGLYVGTAGNVQLLMGGNLVVFNALPVGFYWLRFTAVVSTLTTASNLLALY